MGTVINCCISAAPTFPPQNPSLSLLTSCSINVTWLPPPPEHQNGIIRHYLINVTETETGMSTLHMSNTTWLLLNELHPHYNYVLLFAAVTVDEGYTGSRLLVKIPEDGKHAHMHFLNKSNYNHFTISQLPRLLSQTSLDLLWTQHPSQFHGSLLRSQNKMVSLEYITSVLQKRRLDMSLNFAPIRQQQLYRVFILTTTTPSVWLPLLC